MSADIKKLFEAEVHFGHQTSRWNPKMAKYIYGKKDGIHITSQLQPGDLVFVNGGYHVTMYLGNSRCVHEPSPGGVCMVSPLSHLGGIHALGFPLA